MNLLKNLLAVVATTAMIGSAQATTYDMGTLSPTLQEQTEFYASGTTFADVFNFTVGAQYQTGTSVDQTSVSDLTLTFYSGDGSVIGEVSSSNGSLIDLSGAFVSGDYSARVSGIADGSLGGGYEFSVAATPEPAEWRLLLGGLLVAGFIARRKVGFAAA